MNANATQQQIDHICERIRQFGYTPHLIQGEERTVIAAIGKGDKKEHIESLKSADGVEDAFPILQPFKLVSTEVKKERSVIKIGDVKIGDGGLVVMAGPCSVETRDQLLTTAESVAKSGAQILRGGAYKPRTSPYEFQGLAEEGLKMLAEAREKTGLKVVTEILNAEDVELVEAYADILQVGARNMQNFELLKKLGKINLITPAEVVGIEGNGHVERLTLDINGEMQTLDTDFFIPLFGLTPKLGAIANWGLEIEKNAIKVNNALDYQTNIPGIYAIGDVNTYPGKLKLILCGFHEATLMCQSVYQRLNPGKKYVLKYTTVSGVDGFDGSRKEAEKAVVKSID